MNALNHEHLERDALVMHTLGCTRGCTRYIRIRFRYMYGRRADPGARGHREIQEESARTCSYLRITRAALTDCHTLTLQHSHRLTEKHRTHPHASERRNAAHRFVLSLFHLSLAGAE